MSAYLESDLRARARAQARLERHTAQCADCTSVLDSLRYMLGRLHQAQAPDLGAEALQIAGAVLARLHEPVDR